MTRRMAVLSVGVVLLVVFGVLGAAVPVPYVAQVPGPTFNTLGEIDGEPIITVEGLERTEAEGELTLTTVGVSRAGLSLVEAVQGWFDDEVSVVPEETVYPAGRSEEETREANRQAFLTSEEAAEAAALAELGHPVKVVVRGLSEDSPAEGQLQEGDAIEAVDGRPTPDLGTLDTVLRAIPGGSEVTVAYTRLGEAGSATVTTRSAADADGDLPADAEPREGSLLGVLVREQPAAPFDVDIAVEDVGGPSAGLMLTLGILDMVGGTDLTGGATVAGTGTIDAEGRVGPIGGIQLKMIAAAEIGAELFLVPADNCAEALAGPEPQLPTARVATLDDALTALEDLRAGRTPAPC
ncbi:S16 family serine protease [Geodermatophilus sp. DSM 44513]|uniref:YlbL family protein n=1 Tax=Geodermatophilus sp. DSM 44513 TaxID=1528104 RepID=UPI0028F736B6|nr:S16 family serine protease [Geodermatophilus sp. DSM 44513]WNV74681.1 S16 family serine protease [Geodermatophilus sp. DSM 44513]